MEANKTAQEGDVITVENTSKESVMLNINSLKNKVSTTFPSDVLAVECTEYRHNDLGNFQDLPTKILLSDIRELKVDITNW